MLEEPENRRELLSARPTVAIWREIHSMVVRAHGSSSSARGPLALLNFPQDSPCDIIVCAMSTNPKQAAEITDLIESVYHIPSKLHSQEGQSCYQATVAEAEHHAMQLGKATEEYRNEIDKGWDQRLKGSQEKWVLKENLHSRTTRYYWTKIEYNLFLLFEHINAIGTDDSESTLASWRTLLYRTARDAYRIACGRETPRQVKAFVKGLRVLEATIDHRTDNRNTREEEHVPAS
jgi:CRISPR system Cascade subunit CasA